MTQEAYNLPSGLKYLLLILIGTFPALSVIVDGYGSTIWYLLGLTGIVSFAVSANVRNRFRFEPKAQLFAALPFLFFVWSIIIYWLVDPSDFAKSRVQRHALLLISIPVIALLFSARFRVKDLLLSFSLSGLVFLVYWFLYDRQGRLDGLVHAIHFGNIALITLTFSIGGLLTQRRRHLHLLAAFGSAGALVAFIEAGSRGGLVALFLALLAIGFWFSVTRNQLRYFFVMLALVAFVTAMLVNFVDPISKRYKSTLHEVEELSKGQMYNSIGVRLLLWGASIDVITDSPLIGSGFSGYRTEILTRVSEAQLRPNMSNFSSEPHNQYLYQLASHGLIGLFFLIIMLSLPLLYLAKPCLKDHHNHRIIRAILAIIFLSFIFFGLTITLFDQRKILQNFGLCYAVATWFICTTRQRSFH